jgi:hypothetical protein
MTLKLFYDSKWFAFEALKEKLKKEIEDYIYTDAENEESTLVTVVFDIIDEL